MTTTETHQHTFPFSAIVGQEILKKALLLNCINPAIGGVLICGEKGTAKSTIVRSLSALFPHLNVVTLPLNATEDMVLGGLDIEKALQEGITECQPGVLAKAHGNILYIDEVNLLSESLLNTILDASASGVCRIEREGISYTFPCKFILIGSMNPEEGGLRPQILDRFGFFVDIKGEMNPRSRKEIIKKRLLFEQDPKAFCQQHDDDTILVRGIIEKAQALLPSISPSESTIMIIAELCKQAFVAGHRADMAFCNGAMALAALEGRKKIARSDIETVKDLALIHRIRSVSQPQNDENNSDQNDSDNEQTPQPEENKESQSEDQENSTEPKQSQLPDNSEQTAQEDNDKPQQSDQHEEEELYDIGTIDINSDIIENYNDSTYRNSGSGRRSKTRTSTKHGHYVKVRMPKHGISDLAFDATLRVAAPYQKLREKNGMAVSIKRQDIRVKVREKRIGHTILFLLDTSGSMGLQKRMSETKAAVFELLKESYKKRDTVGLMSFNQHDASLKLHPTRSLDLAHKCLKDVKVGGKTPLSIGLLKSTELMKSMLRKNNEIMPVVVIISDGRANYDSSAGKPWENALQVAKKISAEPIRFIVVDTEVGFIRLGMAKKLAATLQADYFYLEDLKNIKLMIG